MNLDVLCQRVENFALAARPPTPRRVALLASGDDPRERSASGLVQL